MTAVNENSKMSDSLKRTLRSMKFRKMKWEKAHPATPSQKKKLL